LCVLAFHAYNMLLTSTRLKNKIYSTVNEYHLSNECSTYTLHIRLFVLLIDVYMLGVHRKGTGSAHLRDNHVPA